MALAVFSKAFECEVNAVSFIIVTAAVGLSAFVSICVSKFWYFRLTNTQMLYIKIYAHNAQ